jgi:hypothetical protein
MEVIEGQRMQYEEGRQKVKKDVKIVQGKGKHRLETCIAGYVRRELKI